MIAPRIVKVGVDWFPLPTAMSHEYELLEAEYGIKSFGIVIKLLQKIFGGSGYYCRWTREAILFFCQTTRVKETTLIKVVNAAMERGIFHQGMYRKYEILTSREIQERYFQAAGRRQAVQVEERYLLIPYTPNMVTANGKWLVAGKEGQSACKWQQRREENSKEEERRGEESTAPKRGGAPPKKTAFHNFEERTTDWDEISRKILEKRIDRER